jgi:serine/threonine protein kinase
VRFKDEIATLRTASDVAGILPILDSYLPAGIATESPWYVMPLATPVDDWAKKVDPITRVMAIAEAASTMAELHSRGIGHRDIKPANLVIHNDRCHMVDFGLVIYPGKVALTGKEESIGPLWTMAPEIRRKHEAASPFAADVYSLGKTLWILATLNRQGFDGQYRDDGDLAVSSVFPELHVTPLDRLLSSATANKPADRPTMQSFATKLQVWLEESNDFAASNPQQWEETLRQLFPYGLPTHTEWKDSNDIVRILNLIGPTPNLNHLFYPDGGGNDLSEAKMSRHEAGCIEFKASGWSLIKPSKLSFEGVENDAEWSYFRLELAELEPCGVYEARDDTDYVRPCEEVTEIDNETYAERSCWDEDRYDDDELPENARTVVRWFSGSIVIFQKTSFYNLANGRLDAYNGRHSKLNAVRFRKHIEDLREIVIEKKFNIREVRYKKK